MILQRLCEAAAQFGFPPPGYQKGPVKWIVSLDRDAKCLGFIRTTGDETRKNDPGKVMFYPATATPRSGTQPPAQLLADKASFAIGFAAPDASDKDRLQARKNHDRFSSLITQCAALTKCRDVTVVQKALDGQAWHGLIPEEMKPDDVMTFSVDGELPIEDPCVRAHWAETVSQTRKSKSAGHAACLVCGCDGLIANPQPKMIKRIPGGQTSGCALISINELAYDSYGHNKDLSQSPICWDCAQQYLDVLQTLVDSERHSFRLPQNAPPPKQRLMYIFWTRQPADFDLHRMLTDPDPTEVRGLFESVRLGGAAPLREPEDFYALAISGSKTRIVIRDWFATSIQHVQENLSRYFEALEVVDNDGQPGGPIGVYGLLGALLPTKRENGFKTPDWDKLEPNLAAQFVHAVLNGNPLPGTLLQRAISRARAEQGLTRPRAALIKLCLLLSSNREEGLKLTAELNAELKDPAYLCGRLLAILESVQHAAVRGAKSTLIDKYYGTAATAPASVFGLLMRQAQPHLAKLRKTNEGAHYRLQQALEEVVESLPEFPTILRLNEQGKFALGYYQQRAADRASRNDAIAAKKQAAGENDSLGGTDNV